MNITHRTWRFTFISLIAFSFALILVGCSPAEMERLLGGANPPSTAYPAPILTGMPTQAVDPSAVFSFVNPTPRPGERDRVGEGIEIYPTPKPTLPFVVERQRTSVGQSSRTDLFLTNSQTGETIRLGNDSGHAYYDTTTERYIFWWFDRIPYDENAPLKNGLYAYDMVLGQNILVEDTLGAYLDVVMDAESDWLLYSINTPPRKQSIGRTYMHLHNLTSGEDLELSQAIPHYDSRRPKMLYAINDGKVAWLELDETTRVYSVWLYDIATRTSRVLKATDIGLPNQISVSDHFVVWLDNGVWQGYNLSNDSIFTIPNRPSGWEQNRGPVYVAAEGDHIEWRVRGEEATHSYITAPVIPNP